jgi:hypothetical protein
MECRGGGKLDELDSPPKPSQREGFAALKAGFSKSVDRINKGDAVGVKFGIVLKCRSFSLGDGDEAEILKRDLIG